MRLGTRSSLGRSPSRGSPSRGGILKSSQNPSRRSSRTYNDDPSENSFSSPGGGAGMSMSYMKRGRSPPSYASGGRGNRNSDARSSLQGRRNSGGGYHSDNYYSSEGNGDNSYHSDYRDNSYQQNSSFGNKSVTFDDSTASDNNRNFRTRRNSLPSSHKSLYANEEPSPLRKPNNSNTSRRFSYPFDQKHMHDNNSSRYQSNGNSTRGGARGFSPRNMSGGTSNSSRSPRGRGRGGNAAAAFDGRGKRSAVYDPPDIPQGPPKRIRSETEDEISTVDMEIDSRSMDKFMDMLGDERNSYIITDERDYMDVHADDYERSRANKMREIPVDKNLRPENLPRGRPMPSRRPPSGGMQKTQTHHPLSRSASHYDDRSSNKEATASFEDDEDVSEESEDDADDDEDEDDEDEDQGANIDDSEFDDPDPTSKLKYKSAKEKNNALDRILAGFKLDASFFDTQSLTCPTKSDIQNIDDDLQRELAFYKQALWGAKEAERKFLRAKKQFNRPNDYFAEMVKSDAHMERVRSKLVDESAALKASDEAKKQREMKKYGKQVQMATMAERQRAKKDLEDQVKSFKQKRKSDDREKDEEFNVDVDYGRASLNNGRSSYNRARPPSAPRGRGNVGRGGSTFRGRGGGGRGGYSSGASQESTASGPPRLSSKPMRVARGGGRGTSVPRMIATGGRSLRSSNNNHSAATGMKQASGGAPANKLRRFL